jgi:hypothetical protein
MALFVDPENRVIDLTAPLKARFRADRVTHRAPAARIMRPYLVR